MSVGLLICNVCQRGVSSDAVTCPGCGAPLSEKRMSSTGVTLMIGNLLVSVLACPFFGPSTLVCGAAFGIGIAILGAIGAMSELAPLPSAARVGTVTDAERLNVPFAAFAKTAPRATNRYIGSAVIAAIVVAIFYFSARPDSPATRDEPSTYDEALADSEADEEIPSEPAVDPADPSAPPTVWWFCACIVEQTVDEEEMVTACRRNEPDCRRLADHARTGRGSMLRLDTDCSLLEGSEESPEAHPVGRAWTASARAGGTQLRGECLLADGGREGH